MKLVIDIDEKEYERAMNRKTKFPRDLTRFENIITNGKPLSSVIDDIKAEINYVGAHSDYGMQCVFAVAVAIIDKHMERIKNENQC